MADLQSAPAEGLITAGPTITTTTTPTTPSTAIPVSTDNNNENLGPSLVPKRQRRPSVRLGGIGDPPATLSYDSLPHRPKTWKSHKDPPGHAGKASKTRPLTNLVNGGNCHETLDTVEENNNNLDFGNRKPKSNKPTKRLRTNWIAASKIGHNNNGVEGNNSREEDNNKEEFRDLEPDGSENPLREQSPVHSIDNAALDFWHRRPITARVSESRDHDNGFPESNYRDRKFDYRKFGERKHNRLVDDGVRDWLIGLGLGRYVPVFEIHEVDDEVLSMLTLEDLKDMGINSVGSRRKIHTAILKLREEGFS